MTGLYVPNLVEYDSVTSSHPRELLCCRFSCRL